MFQPEEKLDVTQISLTGTRSLVLIGLLIIAPRTFDEIKQIFIEMGIFDKKNSDDILRIDLNTIKLAGCELTRPCKSNGFTYSLKKHPFALELTKDEVKLLKRVYTRIKDKINIKVLIAYDDLFRKISDFVFDEEIKENLLGISALKHFNVDEIKEFYSDCEQHKTLELVYKQPETKKEVLKNVKAQKLVFQNDKIYLYGYDKNIKASTVLFLKRIKKVLSKTFDNADIPSTEIEVIFKLKDFDIEDLTESEAILETNEKESLTKGVYYNNFLAIQRILSFGPKCTILEPMEIKEQVVAKLKEMREVYNG